MEEEEEEVGWKMMIHDGDTPLAAGEGAERIAGSSGGDNTPSSSALSLGRYSLRFPHCWIHASILAPLLKDCPWFGERRGVKVFGVW